MRRLERRYVLVVQGFDVFIDGWGSVQIAIAILRAKAFHNDAVFFVVG